MSAAFHRPISLLLVLVGIGAVVVTWGQVVRVLAEAKPVAVAPGARTRGIVWADRVFDDPLALRRWLRSRGASYERWAELHPADAAVLEHRSAPAAEGTASATSTDASGSRSARPQPVSTGHPIVRTAILAFLLLAASAFAWCAVLPAPFRRRFPEVTARVWPYRSLFGTGAVAIVVGVAVGAVLG